MEWLGFTHGEIRTITLISALVSALGPIIVGIILDRVSVKRPANYGNWLRVLLFICFIATGIFFGLLFAIAPEQHQVLDKEPKATFSCDDHSGRLFTKRTSNQTCEDLSEHNGHLNLYNCTYTCELPENFKYLYHPSVAHFKNNPEFAKIQLDVENVSDDLDYDVNKSDVDDNLLHPDALTQAPTQGPLISPPHICIDNGSHVNCHVYLDGVNIRISNVEGMKVHDNDTNKFSDNWCKHPLSK